MDRRAAAGLGNTARATCVDWGDGVLFNTSSPYGKRGTMALCSRVPLVQPEAITAYIVAGLVGICLRVVAAGNRVPERKQGETRDGWEFTA